jgi:predicted aspartyl protease
VVRVRVRWVTVLFMTVLTMLAVMAADCEVNTEPGVSATPSGKSTRGKRTAVKRGEVAVSLRVITTGGETLVIVPIKVNGRGPYDFVLDTGASSSTVSRSLTRRLRLPETGATAHVRGVAGDTVVPLVKVRAWTLGGQRLRGRSLPVIDLGGNFGESQIGGLLGSDELRRFGAVRLDYKNRKLILRDR